MSTYEYPGQELDLFAEARNWKRYFSSVLRPDINGKVVEVGAGIGGTTKVLRTGSEASWLCLEPDSALREKLDASLHTLSRSEHISTSSQTLAELDPNDRFDTILYIDVLEHIEHDRAELEVAARHLTASGKIIVLSPAYMALFSPFDEAVGHFRRYTKQSLNAVTPSSLTLTRSFYLDGIGVLPSWANRLLLRKSTPSAANIRLWDRAMVPISRLFFDRMTFRSFGRSVIAIWERADRDPS